VFREVFRQTAWAIGGSETGADDSSAAVRRIAQPGSRRSAVHSCAIRRDPVALRSKSLPHSSTRGGEARLCYWSAKPTAQRYESDAII